MPIAKLPLTIPDLIYLDDLDPNGGETTSDLQSLAQDLYHLLLEAPGTNLDDPNAGIGVEGRLNGPAAALASLPAVIDAQLRKDDRVTSSRSTLTQDSTGAYLLGISIVPVGSLVPIPFAFKYNTATGLVPVTP